MERIASFSVDHNQLLPGVYVSRSDCDEATGCITTTFDLRMTAPNREPVMDTAAVHAIEHLGATFLRNDPDWSSKVIYFGPMGCRTGFYLVLFGEYQCLQTSQISSSGSLSSRATSKATFPAQSPRSAATTMTRISLRLNGGQGATLPRHSRSSIPLTPITLPCSISRCSLVPLGHLNTKECEWL